MQRWPLALGRHAPSTRLGTESLVAEAEDRKAACDTKLDESLDRTHIGCSSGRGICMRLRAAALADAKSSACMGQSWQVNALPCESILPRSSNKKHATLTSRHRAPPGHRQHMLRPWLSEVSHAPCAGCCVMHLQRCKPGKLRKLAAMGHARGRTLALTGRSRGSGIVCVPSAASLTEATIPHIMMTSKLVTNSQLDVS